MKRRSHLLIVKRKRRRRRRREHHPFIDRNMTSATTKQLSYKRDYPTNIENWNHWKYHECMNCFLSRVYPSIYRLIFRLSYTYLFSTIISKFIYIWQSYISPSDVHRMPIYDTKSLKNVWQIARNWPLLFGLNRFHICCMNFSKDFK